ncbi:MAG: hypothetical protein R3B13_12885 [Polyangiaceae bacterium]
MQSKLSLRFGGALATTLMMTTWLGCVRQYRPPSANEPHAVLKLRRSYAQQLGTDLSERALLNGEQVLSHQVASSLAAAPLTDALLVHPTPARLDLATTFGHYTTQLVQEQYTEQVPYQDMETYNCGVGTSYQTCTRSVTRYRTEYKTRMVNKTVFVSDGNCSAAVQLAPQVGKSYLIQYDFQANGVCKVACFEQNARADGEFDNRPCPIAAAEAK